MILENSFVLDEKCFEFVHYVTGGNFPMYYVEATRNGYMNFCHTLMNRQPDFSEGPGIINSDLFTHAKHIFDLYCEQNNIEYTTIYRAAINCVFHSKKLPEIHRDHGFKHNVFLFYLTEFSEGETLIYDEERKNVIHTIKPELFKAVVFSGEPHTILPPGIDERRMVLVVTFI